MKSKNLLSLFFAAVLVLGASSPSGAVVSSNGSEVSVEAIKPIDTFAVQFADEFTTVTSLGGGVFESVISNEPVAYDAIDGELVAISTALRVVGSEITAPDTPLTPEFPANIDDKAMVSMSNDAYDISFVLNQAEDSAAITALAYGQDFTAPNEVLYRDAVNGSDLRYEVNNSSIKETIVLESQPLDSNSVWDWTVTAPGLSLRLDEVGQIVFEDSEGVIQFHIPAPIMWDSSGISGIREPAESMLAVQVHDLSNGKWSIVIDADDQWLAAPERDFPIYVDPTISLGDSTVRAFKSDGTIRTDAVHIGNSRDSNTNKYWRSVVKYDYSSVFGKQVLDATITATYIAGSIGAYTGSINTASCVGYDCVSSKVASWVVDSDGALTTDSLSQLMSDWVNIGAPGKALLIRGAEISSYTYKSLNTVLKIRWRDFPDVVTTSPEQNQVVSTHPTLEATPSNYVGGYQTNWKISTQPSMNVGVIYESGWQNSNTWDVPPGVLTPGNKYFWSVSIRDSQYSLWDSNVMGSSPTKSFEVANSAPVVVELPTLLSTQSDDGDVLVNSPAVAFAKFLDPEDDPFIVEYEIAWEDAAGLGHVEICTSEYAYSNESVPCSFIPPMDIGTVFTYRARALDGFDSSNWSMAQTATFAGTGPIPESDGPYYVEFERSVRIEKAVAIAQQLQNGAIGVHFDSVDIVGDWYFDSGLTLAEFQAQFFLDYGTEPQIASLIFDRRLTPEAFPSLNGSAELIAQDPQLRLKAAISDEFIAPPASVGAVVENFQAAQDSANSDTSNVTGYSAALAPTVIGWYPNVVRHDVIKSATSTTKRVRILSSYVWKNTYSNIAKLDKNFGLEFEINMRSAKYAGYSSRGVADLNPIVNRTCPVNVARVETVAQRRNLTWAVYVPRPNYVGNTSIGKQVGAYDDYNDYLDDCNLNSFAIGIRYPERLPNIAGTTAGFGFTISIFANKGNENTSKISGVVQPVERVTCGLPLPMALTDCMGLNHFIRNLGSPDISRTTLNADRGWLAPSRCWTSPYIGGYFPVSQMACKDEAKW